MGAFGDIRRTRQAGWQVRVFFLWTAALESKKASSAANFHIGMHMSMTERCGDGWTSQVTGKANMSYSLNFDGYWKIGEAGGKAVCPGIYCIYAWSPIDVPSSRLLYIGEAENIETRVEEHMDPSNDTILRLIYHGILENREREPFKDGDREFYFNAAKIKKDRKRVEAAMINYHKPPANEQYVEEFPFEDTEVSVSGKIHRLDSEFIAYQRS